MEAKSGSDPSTGAPAPFPAIQLKKEAEQPVSDARVPAVEAHAPPSTGAPATVVVKRRGRPRKSSDCPWTAPPAMRAVAVVSPPPGFMTPAVEKRGRGRPKGSTNKAKLIASHIDDSTAGEDFVAHLLSVRSGEDIATKIAYFSNEIGARALCVISALGSVSSSVLSQSGSPVGILRNDCECEIISLNGSFIFRETRGVCRKQGMLSVALTTADGEVIGGRVAGPLIASSLVQLVLGSFRQVSMKKQEKKLIVYEPSSMACAV